ncbi:MAG: response regulator [Oligoflexales bacterium]|nr:response regulator [Oligoflexales bacterium]
MEIDKKNQTQREDGLSEFLLDSILENLPDMVFIKEANSLKFIYLNKAFEIITGYKRDSFIGKSDHDFFPKKEADSFIEKDRAVIEKNIIMEIEGEAISTKSNGIRYLHTKKMPIFGTDGKAYLLGISEDVTDKKTDSDDKNRVYLDLKSNFLLKEKDLVELNKRLSVEVDRTKSIMKALGDNEVQMRLITNALPMLVSYIDKDSRYSFVNLAYEKWFGKANFEIIGSKVIDVVGAEFFAQTKPFVDQIASSRGTEFKITSTDKFSRKKDLSVTYIPDFSSSKEFRGYVEIIQDITERNRQEAEKLSLLARESAAVEASKLKSEFLANMSHEIRTPINSIMGMAGLLLSTKLDDEQTEFANNIKISADSLLSIINDILDFSKVEAGKLEFEDVTFDIVSTFQDLHKSFLYAAKSKKLDLVQDIGSNIPLFVKGDPGRIRQIVTNLLSNSIKFTSNGKITLKLSKIHDDGKQVRLECQVQDTGIGMSKKSLDNIFQPFTQADSSIYRQYGGTGLGLVISNKLVHLMGGEIKVESEPNIGSKFYFSITLPKVEHVESVDLSHQIAIDKEKSKHFKILVAEDNAINQKIAQKNLESMGFMVDCVSNGKEVIQTLARIPYDMILMDCQMPEMDGYEATEIIRKDPALPNHIPIIATTANAMRGDAERCIQAGMDDYISKPMSKIKLASLLNKWVERLIASKNLKK